MPRVLVAGMIHDSGLTLLKAEPDIELDHVETLDPNALDPFLSKAEAILVRTQPITADVVARCPALKIVSRHGVGYDSVDVAALTARSIPLTIVGDVIARSVAEHAMMLLLAASRRLPLYDAASRPGGDWGYRDSLAAREISGKRLLIIGLGRIGRNLAAMARGFGIEVWAYDPFLSGPPPADVALIDDLGAALPDVDLISLHAPKTERPILGAAEVARLKSSAVVVNAARGGAVDEAALASALSEGRLQGVGLDVYSTEPPAADNPVIGLPEAVLTPHTASMTQECAERMAVVAARNIVDCFNGRLNPDLVVNGEAIGLGGAPEGMQAGARGAS